MTDKQWLTVSGGEGTKLEQRITVKGSCSGDTYHQITVRVMRDRSSLILGLGARHCAGVDGLAVVGSAGAVWQKEVSAQRVAAKASCGDVTTIRDT